MTGMAQNCILFHYTTILCNDINYMVLVLFRMIGKKIITCNILFLRIRFDSKSWKYDK
jgi:hypothetical protein